MNESIKSIKDLKNLEKKRKTTFESEIAKASTASEKVKLSSKSQLGSNKGRGGPLHLPEIKVNKPNQPAVQ